MVQGKYYSVGISTKLNEAIALLRFNAKQPDNLRATPPIVIAPNKNVETCTCFCD